MSRILTIGHSTHDTSAFLRLLQQHHVTAVADVRSIPLSRHTPQFNRGAIEHDLDATGIKYVFMGEQLGARTNDLTCYANGRVQYERLSRTPEFSTSIKRLLTGAQSERIAIMCAEAEPLECHRTVLIAQVLAERGVGIDHIHRNGSVESHAMAMERLMARFGLHQAALFHSWGELLKEALSRQEHRIAYVNHQLDAGSTSRQ